VIHAPHVLGLGVVSLTTVPQNEYKVAIASGGNQSVKLWSAEGECVHTLYVPIGTTPLSEGLASWRAGSVTYFASALRSVHGPQPRVRLPPSNREEAKRVAEAEESADAMDAMAAHMRVCVQLWSLSDQGVAEDHLQVCGPYPINALLFSNSRLIAGDVFGGLHIWQMGSSVKGWVCERRLRLHPPKNAASILSLKPLTSSRVIACSAEEGPLYGDSEGMTPLNVPQAIGVFLIDIVIGTVLAVLAGHIDSVICMCPLPNGGLVTGGGKKDATVQLWMPSLWQVPSDNGPPLLRDASSKLKDPGYCLALTVLPDADTGSLIYAVAAARYNAIKVVL